MRRGNLVATVTLLVLFVIAVGLVVAVLLIPLRGAVRQAGSRLVTYGTLYFALIGMGFMLIEIGLLQRLSIFLGHPVYSLSVLLSSLILSTGIGSFLSEKLVLGSKGRLAIWGAAAGSYALALPFVFGPLFEALSAAELGARIAASVALIAPAGILLGFGFPTGMRLVSVIDAKPTPWFWGINGAASVLASIIGVTLSLAFGIAATLVLGALCYLSLIPISAALLQPQKAPVTAKAETGRTAGRKPAKSSRPR